MRYSQFALCLLALCVSLTVCYAQDEPRFGNNVSVIPPAGWKANEHDGVPVLQSPSQNATIAITEVEFPFNGTLAEYVGYTRKAMGDHRWLRDEAFKTDTRLAGHVIGFERKRADGQSWQTVYIFRTANKKAIVVICATTTAGMTHVFDAAVRSLREHAPID